MDKENDPKKNNDRDADFREVAKVWGSAEAEVIRSLLESEGIQCILKGRVVQSVLRYTADGLGEIRVFVAAEDFELAESLLKEKR
jgi:hypothetical protein